jgi:protein TonB
VKFAWLLGIVCAVLFHVAVLLFGGIFFMDKKKDAGTLQQVDLLSDVKEEKKDKPQPEEPKEKQEVETEGEEPPDAAEIMKSLDTLPADPAPALEAASLSAIESALNGSSGGGDFSQALTFASGGRIGGTGIAGAKTSEKIEEAFNPNDIDQKPRVVFQESPLYPSEMRGKKVEGAVVVVFVVDANGKVTNAKAIESTPSPVFEPPALDAVRKWKFEPGLRAGQRVASRMRVRIVFPSS